MLLNNIHLNRLRLHASLRRVGLVPLFLFLLITGCLPQIDGCPASLLDPNSGMTSSPTPLDHGGASGPASFEGDV
jgi:hypothetical protein